MDFGTTHNHIALIAIPLLAICIPIIHILVGGIVRIRRHQQLHETIRRMTEKGLPIPEELIKAVVSGNESQTKPSSQTLFKSSNN